MGFWQKRGKRKARGKFWKDWIRSIDPKVDKAYFDKTSLQIMERYNLRSQEESDKRAANYIMRELGVTKEDFINWAKKTYPYFSKKLFAEEHYLRGLK